MNPALKARDACNGTCETQPGCECLRRHPAEASTSIGADMPGRRAPLPNSVARWALVAFGGVVLILALIGAGALYAWAGAALMKDKPATTSTTKATT